MDHPIDTGLPLLNAVAFDEMAFNDPALQRELLQAFLEQVPGAASELDTLQEPSALREVLHLLKGSSQCICAERLHALLKQAEAAFAAPAPAPLRQSLLEASRVLLAQTRQVASDLDAELARRGA